jgi:two-component system response regulator HydG
VYAAGPVSCQKWIRKQILPQQVPKALPGFSEKKFDVLICDYRLGDMRGTDVVTALKKINPHIIILVITGYSDIKTAVEVIKLGALDYIVKPLIPDEVLNVLHKH